MANKNEPDDIDELLSLLDEQEMVNSIDHEPAQGSTAKKPTPTKPTPTKLKVTGKLSDLTKPIDAPNIGANAPLETAAKQHVIERSREQSGDDQAQSNMAVLLEDIKHEFERVSSYVLDEWRDDRDQIQSVIQSLITAIGTNPNNAERHVVEGLVKLLDTKVHSGMLAVKLLEVKTKLLLAAKSTSSVVINNQNMANVGGQNAELTELLAQPPESDF